MTCKSCTSARTPPRKGCAETTWNVSRLVVAHDPVAANRRTVARDKKIADLVTLGQQCSVKLDEQDESLRTGTKNKSKAARCQIRAIRRAFIMQLKTPIGRI